MLAALRFWWTATRGHRFAVWRSPYLRWRLETYTGVPAAAITRSHVLALLVAERGQLLRFRSWLAAMRRLRRAR